MPITYPRNTDADYVLFRESTGEVIKSSTTYPREDGMELVGADPDLVYLEIIEQLVPDYDPRIFILTKTSTPDTDAGTWTVEYGTEKRPDAEIELSLENVETTANEQILPYNKQLKLMLLGLGVLFRRADGATLNAKEQAIADRVVAIAMKVWQNDANLRAKVSQLANGEEPNPDDGYERDPS